MNSTEVENTYENHLDYYWVNTSYSFCEFFNANFTRQYLATINIPAAYILWILCVFGCVGNIITIIVVWAYNTSTSTLLTVLAVSDTALLLTGALIPPVYLQNKQDMYTYFICYVPIFSDVPYLVSPWILVTITIERVVSVVMPFRVKTIFSVKKTRIYVALQIVIALSYYAFDLYELEVVDNECVYRTTIFEYIHHTIKPWVDVIVNAILPGSIICIGNIVIITHLFKMSKLRGQMTASKRHDVSITTTLVAASCIFCIIMLPNTVYYILRQQLETETDPDRYCSILKRQFDFAPIGTYSVHLNACLNFYIYVISGTAFRNDVRRTLKRMMCNL